VRILILVLVAILIPPTASAMLKEVDLFAPGDALVTRDTVAGLDWLDLTLTLGLSYDDIVLGGAGGWTGDGWQHATCDQVVGLFAAAGMVPLACPSERETGGDNTPRDFLMDLIGRTNPAASVLPNTALGIYEIGSVDRAGFAEVAGEGGGFVNCYDGINPIPCSSVGAQTMKFNSFDNFGHFLVHPIPEPNTALLLSIGLAGLASWPRRLA